MGEFDELSDYVGEHGLYGDPLHGSAVGELVMRLLAWTVGIGLPFFLRWFSRRPVR